MLDNFTYPADIFPSSRFYHQDLADEPLELIHLPDGTPGVQAATRITDPNPQRLEKLTIEKASLPG
jgi:hypothetical protein